MFGKIKSSLKGFLQAGCFVTLCVVLVSCAAIIILPNIDTPDEAPVARVSVAVQESTPTEIPTATPIPTPTALVSLGVDRTNYTELQWKPFVNGLKGKLISGQGEIDQVKSNGTVIVDIHIGAINQVYLKGLAIDDAAKLSKKQVIHFIGWLVDVDDFMGYLYLDVDATEWYIVD